MALSNIFREPRREITEQITGFAVVAPFVLLDYAFAAWLERISGPATRPGYTPLFVGLLLGVLVLIFGALVVLLLTVVVHAIGEGVCNALQNRGVHLRPQRRY